MNYEKNERLKNKIYEQIQRAYSKYNDSCKDIQAFRNLIKNDLSLYLTKEEKDILDIIEYYNNQIMFFWSLIEKEKDYKYKINKLEEEKKKQMMEEQKKLKELEDKKAKINNDFNKEVEKIKTEKIKRIEEELKGMEKTFCMKEIQDFDTNKIRELLKSILKSNKIAKFIENNLKIYIDKNRNNIKNTEHLNIILVGPSGVGKSTLINAILELEKQTETGFGMPQTMDIGFYNSNKLTFLRLADSRGIEKAQDFGVEAICKEIENFIKKQLDTKDPDKYIHCIWYCWTGARLELSEIDILNKLSKQYSLKTLPVIIVYTNAIDPGQAEDAEKYIKQKLKLDNYFIPVLAKEKKVGIGKDITNIRPYNLDKLKEISFELAKSAVESSCYQGLIEDIKKTISEEINNLTNKIKESIDIDVKKIIYKMNLDSKIEDLYNDNTNIILNIFYKYIFLDANIKIEDNNSPKTKIGDNYFSISPDSHIAIKKFIIDYFENTLQIYKKSINELLIKYSQELSNEIIEFQIKFNLLNDHLLITPWTIEELKATLNQFIFKSISKKTEFIVLKNSFNFIINSLIKNFGNYFILLYNKTMENDKFKNYAQKLVPSSFDEIGKKIKEYNENKKDAPPPNDEIRDEEERNELEDLEDIMNDDD